MQLFGSKGGLENRRPTLGIGLPVRGRMPCKTAPGGLARLNRDNAMRWSVGSGEMALSFSIYGDYAFMLNIMLIEIKRVYYVMIDNGIQGNYVLP